MVVVLSGGNTDPLLLFNPLRHGLAAVGRYLAFRCRLPASPGSLAKLLGDLADLDTNVLEVGREQLGPRLSRSGDLIGCRVLCPATYRGVIT